MRISDAEKWSAFCRKDRRYDGLFYVGVKTTGIYCRPSCTARLPLRKNVTFHDTGAEAARHGFRPCKRCRPDQAAYAPGADTARQLKALIDERYTQGDDLVTGMGSLGVTPGHLTEVFRRHYGITPFSYRNRLRTALAANLLKTSAMSVADIAFACGFESLSSFYRHFRRETGVTPTEFRKSAVATGGKQS